MKILMQNRPMVFSEPGGDTIQMIKTKEWLEKKGVMVDISLEREPNVKAYDLVHVFNMQDGAVTHSSYQILNAKRQGKPVALSTIYWNLSESDGWREKSKKEKLRWYRRYTFQKIINSLLRKTLGIEVRRVSGLEWMVRSAKEEESKYLNKYQQMACLLLADILLPNAMAELELLKKDFGMPLNNAYVIPNGVDPSFQNSDGAEFIDKNRLKDFVLCVARIDPVKNQLFLIRALRDSGLSLVLIGRPGTKEYYRRCLHEYSDKVLFIDAMPHEELKSAYGAAKVHALPSFRETPGLVSLEAGLAGCNLVITNRGSTEEYFGKYAYYCEPDDVASIRNAVMEAFKAPRTDGLAKHIGKNYTWEKAAEKTLEAYGFILRNEKKKSNGGQSS